MTAWYATIKNVHVYSVLLSLALFVLRGGLMLGDSSWLHWRFLRTAPHIIDTVLLASALLLTTIIRQYPFAQSWLTAKVLALVVYIVLGSIAIKRGRSKLVRLVAFVAALGVFGYIYAVARTHAVLGPTDLLGR